MRSLVFVLLFSAVVSAEDVVPFESLKVFDPLPAYTEKLPSDIYIKWVEAQNQMCYRRCRQKADEWDARNPALEVYVQRNDYHSASTLHNGEESSSGTRYNGGAYNRTFRCQTRWCGGCIPVINPYVRSAK